MATKKTNSTKIDYKDSSLHADLQEIKILLAMMSKDIEIIAANTSKMKEIDLMRAGME